MDRKAFESQAKIELKKAKIDIENLKVLTKPIAPENAIGRISRMDAINNKSVNEAALRSLIAKVKSIEIALNKINDADFGICRKCIGKQTSSCNQSTATNGSNDIIEIFFLL